MIFVNRRRNNNSQPDVNTIPTIKMLSATNGIRNKNPTLFEKTVNTPIVQPRVKEMLWGEPTWFLFHTLAEKVKPECYTEVCPELMTFIRRICNNLPCPDCTQHATRHINGINFATITKKEHLRLMLFDFHNKVNGRKQYESFPFNDLYAKYSAANTVNIARNFFHHFSKRHYSVRMGVDGYHRNQMLKDFQVWLESKYYCFDP